MNQLASALNSVIPPEDWTGSASQLAFAKAQMSSDDRTRRKIRKKEEAIAALLSQRSVEDAARVVGISTKSLLRWLQMPEFQAGYRQARRDAFGQATARLQQASGAAVSTILKIMVGANSPASTRLGAADIVMDRTAKDIEIEDIEARVAALEKAAGEQSSGRRK